MASLRPETQSNTSEPVLKYIGCKMHAWSLVTAVAPAVGLTRRERRINTKILANMCHLWRQHGVICNNSSADDPSKEVSHLTQSRLRETRDRTRDSLQE